MNLTSAQQTTFLSAINANTTPIPALPGVTSAFVGVQVKNVPQGNDQDGAAAVAAFYNQLAAGPFFIFQTAVPANLLGDNILFSKYTIVTSIPPDTTQLYDNCVEACIAKGIVLQNILLLVQSSGGIFNAARPTLRQGLKDATSNLPSGGPSLPTLVDGGWTTSIDAVPGILTRSATIFESLFAVASSGPLTGSGNLGTSGNVSIPATDSIGGYLQGNLSGQDLLAIWNP